MTIKCQPEAAPTPEITWSQNGQIINNDERHTVLLDGTLHIAQMTASDQGRYTCKAKNQNGESEASTFVSVFGKFVILCSSKSLEAAVLLELCAFSIIVVLSPVYG